MKAHLNRYERLTGSGKNGGKNDEIIIADLKILTKSWKVYKGKTEIKFPNREFELLFFLSENPNIVFSKGKLFEKIWGFDYIGDSATVTVYSFKLFYESIMQYKEYVIKYTLFWQTPMTAFVTAILRTFFLLIPAGILLAVNSADYRHFLLSFILYVIFTPACASMLMKVMFLGNYKMIVDEGVNSAECGANLCCSRRQGYRYRYSCRPRPEGRSVCTDVE